MRSFIVATQAANPSWDQTTNARERACVSAMLLFGIFMSIQLAPDIEAGLRAEAAARGMDVDALIATAVKAYLGEMPTPPIPTPRRVPSRARSAEMAWVSSPDTQFFIG